MRMLNLVGLLICFIAFTTLGFGDEKKDAKKEEKKATFDATKMVGKWSIVGGTKFGDKVEGDSLKSIIVIGKDKIEIMAGDKVEHAMSYKLNTTTTPISIDMVGTEGPAKDMKAEGIVELKGEELKLAYSIYGDKRPASFVSKKDTKVLSFTMKKMK